MTRGLELLIAQTILQGFDAQYGRFQSLPWRGSALNRLTGNAAAGDEAAIHLYDHHVGLVVEQLLYTMEKHRC